MSSKAKTSTSKAKTTVTKSKATPAAPKSSASKSKLEQPTPKHVGGASPKHPAGGAAHTSPKHAGAGGSSKHVGPKAKGKAQAVKAKAHAAEGAGGGDASSSTPPAGDAPPNDVPTMPAEGGEPSTHAPDSKKVTKIQSFFRGHLQRSKNTVICYYCGEHIEASKIAEHQADDACIQATEKLRAELPEKLRGVPAVKPAEDIPPPGSADEAYKNYNKIAIAAYQASLGTCACENKVELGMVKHHITKCAKWKEANGV